MSSWAAKPLSSTQSHTSNRRFPPGWRLVTEEEWFMEVIATVNAPFSFALRAASTITALRPELEIRNSTSFSPSGELSITAPPRPGSRS